MAIFGRHSRKSSRETTSKADKAAAREREKEKEKEKEREKQTPKHHRTKTAPEPSSLLRQPSSSSTVSSVPVPVPAPITVARSRRNTNPSTPTATAPPAHTPHTPHPPVSSLPIASPTSTSYFSHHHTTSTSTTASTPAAAEPRSPPIRRPPASFSAGHDTSRGPPVTLITRGNSDFARRSSQVQYHSLSNRPSRDQDSASEPAPPPPQQQQQQHRRQQSQPQPQTVAMSRQAQQIESSSEEEEDDDESSSSSDESSEYEDGPPSTSTQTRPAADSVHGATDTSGTDGEQNEDIFLHIAEDSAPKQRHADPATRHDKLRSRIARINRMSSPGVLNSPSPVPANSITPTATRTTSIADSRTTNTARRVSHAPTSSRTVIERPPQSPGTPLETPRARPPELSTKASFSRQDSQLSPREFLAQFGSRRRGSQPETLQTPPQRPGYRPSNLGHYSSSRDDTKTPQPEPTQESSSHIDGTESHGSTGPAVSVWDELDELKTRIRRIEMGGKIPSTSGAIVSQATAERPRTANTSATTVSSSPNQTRKSNPSPSESTTDAYTSSRSHPLLRDALAKSRSNLSPAVFRILEATANEALTLAEMTGSAGPQGTLHSASSILGGANVSDRQVRRKADNICRSLTELCIALSDTKQSVASPIVRSSAATISRRPSVQINGDSPTIRQSIEPESNSLSNISPSRALNRIEARRTSMLGNGYQRDASQEPFDDRQTHSRLQRAGTSLHRNRSSVDEEEEEQTMRAPSRAMTDFRSMRPTEKSRFTGRQYMSREPLPDLQPAPSFQTSASLRRPTHPGTENSLLFRDGGRRYGDIQRESSPAYEKQMAGTVRARAQLAASRNPNNRNSIGGITDLNRNITVSRRARGNSTGE